MLEQQANMAPRGIWCGAPFGVGYYIWKSMIPTALGNIVGGGLFVGTAYWYLYLTGEVGVEVSFNMSTLDTAMEAGGPMRSEKKSREGPSTIVGTDPNHLPHSGNPMMSAVGKELSDDSIYAKSHAERTKTNEEKVEDSV